MRLKASVLSTTDPFNPKIRLWILHYDFNIIFLMFEMRIFGSLSNLGSAAWRRCLHWYRKANLPLISFCSEGVEYCISIECCCTDQGIVFYENKLLIRELQLVQSVVDRKFFRPIKLLKQFDHVIMLSSYGKGIGKTFTNWMYYSHLKDGLLY